MADDKPGDEITPELFRIALRNSRADKRFFFPDDCAAWQDGRYSLDRKSDVYRRKKPAGVRLRAVRKGSEEDRTPNEDLVRLVQGMNNLRDCGFEEFGTVVLSDECSVAKSGRKGERLVQFGLLCSPRYRSDGDAAWQCHDQIAASIKRAGFRADPPRPESSGFERLEEWASEVRLKKRRSLLRPLVIAALLIALAAFLLRGGVSGQFFRIPVATRSVVIVVDRSTSMASYFPEVREEARNLLDAMKPGGGLAGWRKTYANFIFYDSQATSVLGEISELNNTTAGKLYAYFETAQSGGGTDLSAAMQVVANEVRTHGQSTTVLVLTDGEDGTIHPMLADPEQQIEAFGDVEVKLYTMTPRLIDPTENTEPINPFEKNLDEFAKLFGGHFGPGKPKQ